MNFFTAPSAATCSCDSSAAFSALAERVAELERGDAFSALVERVAELELHVLFGFALGLLATMLFLGIINDLGEIFRILQDILLFLLRLILRSAV